MEFCDHCQGQRFDRAQVLRALRAARQQLRRSKRRASADYALDLAIQAVRSLDIPHLELEDAHPHYTDKHRFRHATTPTESPMFLIEKTAEFVHPPEQVFALMSDIRNELKWLPGVKSVRKIGGDPVGRGSEFITEYQGFGTMHVRLTEFSVPKLFACAVSGKPVDMTCRFEYEPTPTGTRMTARMEILPHGALRVLQPVLRWMFNREFAKRPEQIRRGLEMMYPRQHASR
jgi:carbon monoxide dehydrogenase subunit G